MRPVERSGGALWVALAALALLVLVLALVFRSGAPAEPSSAAVPPRSDLGAASPTAAETAPRLEAAPTPSGIAPAAAAVDSAPAAPAVPVGTLRVEVFDVDGAALTDVVLLAQRGIKERREQRTDASGLARFEALEVGAWTLFLSDHERPLLPPTPVEVREGEDPLLRLALSAPLTALEVEVVDEAGRPAPNVELRTRCERGGVSRGVTDHAGRAVLRHVSLGPVRVFANDERLGRGNRALEIAAGERPKVQINLATRP
jgi:hypothetical protein